MATTQAKMALRQYRRDNNLCVQCGNPPVLDRTLCEDCAYKARESQRRGEARAVALGICCNPGCNKQPKEGKRRCRDCIANNNSRSSAVWHRRIAAGVCGDCGDKPTPGRTRCVACAAKLNKSVGILMAKRRAAGLCPKCADPILTPGNKQCERCSARASARHEARKVKVMAAYGGPHCVGCPETELVVLQIDHIAGGGNKHALEIGNGNLAKGRGLLYKHLIDNDYPPGYRVLCASCNIRAARGVPFPNQRTQP